MNREQMKGVLDQGRSVFWQGRIITKEAELPSLAELAKGNPAQEAVAVSDLQRQMADLQKQLADLTGGNGPSTTQLPGSSSPTGTPIADSFPFAGELRVAGYATREAVAQASDDELDAVPGIGPASVKQIRAALAG